MPKEVFPQLQPRRHRPTTTAVGPEGAGSQKVTAPSDVQNVMVTESWRLAPMFQKAAAGGQCGAGLSCPAVRPGEGVT